MVVTGSLGICVRFGGAGRDVDGGARVDDDDDEENSVVSNRKVRIWMAG